LGGIVDVAHVKYPQHNRFTASTVRNPLKNILHNYTSHLMVSSSLTFGNGTVQGIAAILRAVVDDDDERRKKGLNHESHH
jgi:hypothetical protein